MLKVDGHDVGLDSSLAPNFDLAKSMLKNWVPVSIGVKFLKANMDFVRS